MGVRRGTTDTEMGVRRRRYRHTDGSKEGEIQTEMGVRGRYRQRWE